MLLSISLHLEEVVCAQEHKVDLLKHLKVDVDEALFRSFALLQSSQLDVINLVRTLTWSL